MDPNACLKELRELVEKSTYGKITDVADYERLTDLVEALDGWLSEGGFLPEDWQKNRQ